MLKLKEKLQYLKNVVEVLEKLTIETDIVFKEEGIFIRAIHLSKHCYVIFEINKSMFEEYNIKKEITYTLNLQLLNKIIKKVGKKELFIKAQDDRLYISGDKNDFQLNYFVGSKDERPRPDIQTSSKWKIKSTDFFSNVSELLDFSEICKIGGSELTLHIKSKMVQGDVNLEAEKIESDGCWCWYDLTYIDMIKDIKNIFDEIRIGFSQTQPIIIRAKNDDIDFEFMLACRVEENDE